MKKHIEDLHNALYKHDLTVSVEEDTSAFHNAYDTGLVPLYASFGCYLMEKPEISLYFAKTNRHSWQRDLAAFIETMMQYIYAAETEHNGPSEKCRLL